MSFDSQEGIEYFKYFKISFFFEILEISKTFKISKTSWPLFVVEDQLSNEVVPYHETKAAIPEFEFLGWPLAA